MIGLLVMLGRLHSGVLGWHLVISALTFLVYALDKWLARRRWRRVPENGLHLLGVLGGWPGAMLASEAVRHKSSKGSFRSWLWITAAVNALVLLWLTTPSGRSMLAWFL